MQTLHSCLTAAGISSKHIQALASTLPRPSCLCLTWFACLQSVQHSAAASTAVQCGPTCHSWHRHDKTAICSEANYRHCVSGQLQMFHVDSHNSSSGSGHDTQQQYHNKQCSWAVTAAPTSTGSSEAWNGVQSSSGSSILFSSAARNFSSMSNSSKQGRISSSSSNDRAGFKPGAHSTATAAVFAALVPHQGLLHPDQLTARIKNSRSHQQLQQLLQQHSTIVNAVHIAAAIQKLAHNQQQQQQQQSAAARQWLLQHLELLLLQSQQQQQLLQQCSSRDTSDMIWAFSVLDHISAAVISAVVQLFMQQLPTVDRPDQISKVLHAAARSQNIGRHLATAELQQLLGAFTKPALLQSAALVHVSNVLRAVETLDIAISDHQLQQLLSTVVNRWAKVTPWVLANTLSAAARITQQRQQQQRRRRRRRQWSEQQQLEQQLLSEVVRKLLEAAPLQYMAVLLSTASAAGWHLSPVQLHQFATALCGKAAAATASEISLTLKAVAQSGRGIPHHLLRQLLETLVTKVKSNKQQCQASTVSTALRALVKLNHVIPASDMQVLTRAVADAVSTARPSAIADLLWACGKCNYFSHELFDALHKQQYWQQHLCEMNLQQLSFVAFACGHLGHRDNWLMENTLQQALSILQQQQQQQQECGMTCIVSAATSSSSSSAEDGTTTSSSSSKVREQDVTNICWAVAVLHCQQLADSVVTFFQVAQSVLGAEHWTHLPAASLQQLYQIHSWLLDCQLAGSSGSTHGAGNTVSSTQAEAKADSTGSTHDTVVTISSTGNTQIASNTGSTGLAGVFTSQQLQQIKAAATGHHRTAAVQVSPLQQAVFAAVQQLPLTWRQPPQMEQLSPDGALLIDIVAALPDGVELAVEVDGPSHFRRPDMQPTGSTLYKRHALTARGYRVVSVGHHLWTAWQAAGQVQQKLVLLIQQGR